MQDSTQTYIILRQYINYSLYAVRAPTSCSTTTTTKNKTRSETRSKDQKTVRTMQQYFADQLSPTSERESFKCSNLRPLILPKKKVTLTRLCSTGAIIMTGVNWVSRSDTCPRVVQCTTNLTQTGLGLNRSCRGDRPSCLPELWQVLEDWSSTTLYIKNNFLPQRGKVPSQPESTVSYAV